MLGDHTHSMLLHYSLPFPSASFLPHSVHLHSHNLPHFTYKYSFIHLILKTIHSQQNCLGAVPFTKSIHYISFTHPFQNVDIKLPLCRALPYNPNTILPFLHHFPNHSHHQTIPRPCATTKRKRRVPKRSYNSSLSCWNV